jgi:hypothetical protein
MITRNRKPRGTAGFKVGSVKAPYAGQDMSSVRRLTAILAADVAGYSRLMGADEEGTHERLKAHLGELVNPKIVEHWGRIVKNTGDGFLAEFASVVDAVRCAVEIQSGMTEREPEVPEERRIRFRIGINLGDHFFSRFAAMIRSSPILPLIGGGTTKFQPVFVDDVSVGLLELLQRRATAGKTYEFGGPQVYSFKALWNSC